MTLRQIYIAREAIKKRTFAEKSFLAKLHGCELKNPDEVTHMRPLTEKNQNRASAVVLKLLDEKQKRAKQDGR